MRMSAVIAASVMLLGIAAPATATEAPAQNKSNVSVQVTLPHVAPTDVSARHRRWHRPVRVCTTHWRHGRRVTVCRWR